MTLQNFLTWMKSRTQERLTNSTAHFWSAAALWSNGFSLQCQNPIAGLGKLIARPKLLSFQFKGSKEGPENSALLVPKQSVIRALLRLLF